MDVALVYRCDLMRKTSIFFLFFFFFPERVSESCPGLFELWAPLLHLSIKRYRLRGVAPIHSPNYLGGKGRMTTYARVLGQSGHYIKIPILKKKKIV